MNENTMTKLEYLKDHVVWGLLVFVMYAGVLFTEIPGYTYKETLFLCAGILAGVLFFGAASTWRRERNFYSVMINVWLAWTVFFIFFYGERYHTRVLVISVITAVVTLGMAGLILARKVKNPGKREIIIRRRIRRVISCARRNIVCASFLLMIPITIDGFGKDVDSEKILSVERVYGEEHNLDTNMELISMIHPDRWGDTDMDQRLEIGQKILNCEARYLGLTNEITLVTKELDEMTRGHYSNADHQIVISSTHLMNASGYDVLETILHECYHAYQYELIYLYHKVDSKSRNLMLFDAAAVYLDEFQDYTNGTEDFYEYYSQSVETDARKHSKNEMQEYIRRVEEYVMETSTVEEPAI